MHSSPSSNSSSKPMNANSNPFVYGHLHIKTRKSYNYIHKRWSVGSKHIHKYPSPQSPLHKSHVLALMIMITSLFSPLTLDIFTASPQSSTTPSTTDRENMLRPDTTYWDIHWYDLPTYHEAPETFSTRKGRLAFSTPLLLCSHLSSFSNLLEFSNHIKFTPHYTADRCHSAPETCLKLLLSLHYSWVMMSLPSLPWHVGLAHK